jgi:DNA-binding FadR family transcriptional regulator
MKSILDMVQDRQLRPGDRLPSERDLAQRLGIGRNAVREGVAALTTLRVLEARPNSGIYLKRISTDSSFETLAMLAELGAAPTAVEITETTEVRQALECLAVQLACARRTEEDLDQLEDILQRTERLLRESGNIAALDTEFHLALVAATHNSVLVRVLHSFYRFTAARRRAWFENQAQGKSSARDHRKLLQAIARRDVEAAANLIERHLQRATAYWGEVLG